ncbi:hypothetical protein JAAARDRAFT_27734 [Jaapia argillacea MUCL 33604]|uniref:Hypervirulence associated protein TUDOR domain-containing protein n=1 Tax=Jaapia argillacea MUCL 33604 TaxID=933084 RepID=A0A067QD60_9AGAM|nr:hypothetical protein JAAARDRAFT_27734 [Jaapia argillacea MUCL 33604]
MSDADIQPGDIVAVHHGPYGRREGLVVGAHYDYTGRQVLEVQMEPGEVIRTWSPQVTRIKRTIYRAPQTHGQRTVERHIYW